MFNLVAPPVEDILRNFIYKQIQVKKIVDEALEEALNKDMSILPDEYIELLEESIHEHYQSMQNKHPQGPM